MTPCEKLGYKVGDKFEVLNGNNGFEKGQVVTLFRDDRTDTPCFKGDNTECNHAGGEPGAYINLSDVKPVSQRVTKPISNSKRQLAQLLIEAGVTQFPEGANWAAQDKSGMVWVYENRPKRMCEIWVNNGRGLRKLQTTIPNWHQTVLSRDEFDQIVAETVVTSEPQYCESVKRSIPEPTATPTLDQLLQDWRNADDFAQRKQTEADEAVAMRDERWQAVQDRAGEMGVTVGRCDPVVVITDWRDLQVGDIVWWSGDSKFSSGEYTVYELEELDHTGPCVILLDVGGCKQWVDHEAEEWRFIRRP